jgi:hypothetical protein
MYGWKGDFDQMAILDRLRANPWVVTLLSSVFTLIMVLSWTTAAYAQSDTPFDAQYTLLGIESNHVDHGQDSGNVAGQEVGDPLLGLLPSTGGPQLWLVILGSAAFCFSGALLMHNVRNRRR